MREGERGEGKEERERGKEEREREEGETGGLVNKREREKGRTREEQKLKFYVYMLT